MKPFKYIKKAKYIFKPNFKIIGKVRPVFEIKDLEKEIGVYSATPDFIKNNYGPIANMTLDKVPKWYYDEAFELGLYPNDFPAFSGWHCDASKRESYFGQPNPNQIKVSKHIICSVSSHEDDVNNAQFLNQELKTALKITEQNTIVGLVAVKLITN